MPRCRFTAAADSLGRRFSPLDFCNQIALNLCRFCLGRKEMSLEGNSRPLSQGPGHSAEVGGSGICWTQPIGCVKGTSLSVSCAFVGRKKNLSYTCVTRSLPVHSKAVGMWSVLIDTQANQVVFPFIFQQL